MGTIDFQQPIVSTSKTNMKLFLIAAVCAEPESEAKADAKPWLAYSNYGYAGYPYAAGYAYLGKRSADSESDAKPWLTYANYGACPYASTYGAYHLIGKREAEADSEAKPWLAYSNYGYAGY